MILIVSLIVVVVVLIVTYLITRNNKLMKENNRLTRNLAEERAKQRAIADELEKISKLEPLIAINTLRDYLNVFK